MDSTITSVVLPNGSFPTTISSAVTGYVDSTTTGITSTIYDPGFYYNYNPQTPSKVTIHIPTPDYYEVDINGDEIPRYGKISIDKEELFDSLGIGIPLSGTWTKVNKIMVRNDGTGDWDNVGNTGDIMVRVGD